MKTTAALIASLIVIAAAIFPSGCDSKGNAPAGGKSDPGQLVGDWAMTSLQTNAPVAGTAVTISFKSDGTFGGSGGVNGYGGKYQADSKGSLKLSEIISTLMASSNPAIQAQETQYFAALGLTARFEVASGTLTFSDAAGGTLVVFKSK